MATNILSTNNESPFDSIRHINEQGQEYWSARELMGLLGYERWERFADAIDRAKASCQNAGNSVREHFFAEVRKSNGRPKEDFQLSRYACYLVAQNGDPRKPEVAAAQTYFAIKTREAEVVLPAQSDRIRELELELRLTQANQKLLDTRNTIQTTCPQPIADRILGVTEVKTIEYRDRIIRNEEVVSQGDTVFKGEICQRLGILTRNGKPDYKRLNELLDRLPPEAFKQTVSIREDLALRREWLYKIEQIWDTGSNRDLYFGE